ncbi:hypothetical protein ACIOMM_30745 [Streptomyces sp. NPDC087908]
MQDYFAIFQLNYARLIHFHAVCVLSFAALRAHVAPVAAAGGVR